MNFDILFVDFAVLAILYVLHAKKVARDHMNGRFTDNFGRQYPVDQNGFRTFRDIEKGTVTKIVATDEAAIESLTSTRTPFATHTEPIFMRIDDGRNVYANTLGLTMFLIFNPWSMRDHRRRVER